MCGVIAVKPIAARHIILAQDGGQRLSVLPYVEPDDGEALVRGRWLVLLYHVGCPRCEEELEVMRQTRPVPGARAPRLAALEVRESPTAETVVLPDHVKHVRLSPRHDWFVRTPVVLQLDEGVVSRVQDSLPGIMAAHDE